MNRTGPNRLVSLMIDNLIWLFVIGAFIAFSLLSDSFLRPYNLGNILLRSAAFGMLVLSQAYTFITGNFDLSVESSLGLTAMFGALMLVTSDAGGWGWQLNPILVILLMLVLGGLIGLFNGVLITKVGVNNLLVTIAMLFVLRGATYGISPGTSISFFPKEFTWLGGGTLTRIVTDNGNFVLSVAGVFVILAFLVGHIHTRYTQFGRNMYAVGADADAARAAGINVDRVVIIVYIIAGVCAAFAGLLQAGRLNAATPTMGANLIFAVHGAAIIGGMSIYGGRGNIIGAFGGVLLWSILDTGLNIMRVSPFWIDVSRGLLLLFAVLLDALRVRYQRNVQMRLALAASTIGLDDKEHSDG